jgi:hypothetical protein
MGFSPSHQVSGDQEVTLAALPFVGKKSLCFPVLWPIFSLLPFAL